MDSKCVACTQVRFILPELLFEVILVLDRKRGISQREQGSKAMLGGRSWNVERDPRAGACSKVEELEGQRDQGAGL